MRLVRFGTRHRESPGLLNERGQIIDLSTVITDFDGRFWGEGGLLLLRELADSGRLGRLPVMEENHHRLGPPVAACGKLLCVGQNYLDHVKEQNAPMPESPVIFTKAVTAITGPYDPILLPTNYQTTDWEVELAVVIGRRTRAVSEDDAMASIAGYVLMNDVSERQAQHKEGGQWDRGKSFDTYAPLGPWVVTADEVDDPHALDLELKINGEIMQQSNTRQMIFRLPQLIAFISRNITLLPGDVISTGTPPGVGAFRHPPVFLQPGDVVELAGGKLGRQRCEVAREVL
jgi:2-keto-4-pentenoate hydratase/2-oxohepta-3-ene-1,7-dioic acid hydratase in catechol pathway